MLNCVQKSLVIKPLRFLGGVLPVDLMLANYSYVVHVRRDFFFPVPYFYLRKSYVKNRKQKKKEQKKKNKTKQNKTKEKKKKKRKK